MKISFLSSAGAPETDANRKSIPASAHAGRMFGSCDKFKICRIFTAGSASK
jgi:hypothetical protein